MNSFILSLYSLRQKRFTDYLVFREALYIGLLAHTEPIADIAEGSY